MHEVEPVADAAGEEIHDNVLQGLAKTKLSLDLGRTEEGEREVEETLAASRKIISDLLGEPGSEVELRPGDLRRQVAAP
jgi:signal transduction histidine kinase